MQTSRSFRFPRSKLFFQIVLIGSNLVPLAAGVAVAVLGVNLFVPSDQVETDFAAQVRVYAIWFTGIFFLFLWVALNIETGGPVLTIVACLVALAGASRFYTMIVLGDFPTSVAIAGVVEMAVLLFIPWHRYLLKQDQT